MSLDFCFFFLESWILFFHFETANSSDLAKCGYIEGETTTFLTSDKTDISLETSKIIKPFHRTIWRQISDFLRYERNINLRPSGRCPEKNIRIIFMKNATSDKQTRIQDIFYSIPMTCLRLVTLSTVPQWDLGDSRNSDIVFVFFLPLLCKDVLKSFKMLV